MGIVYLATDRLTGDLLALKLVTTLEEQAALDSAVIEEESTLSV